MSGQRLVIIGCGATKRAIRSPAGQLYTGSYFRANLAWAMSVVRPDQIIILSAAHGFLRLHDQIEPYDLRMGDENSIGIGILKEQAESMGLLNRDTVAICGQDYLDKLLCVIPDVKLPCRGLTVGWSVGLLKRNRGRWP